MYLLLLQIVVISVSFFPSKPVWVCWELQLISHDTFQNIYEVFRSSCIVPFLFHCSDYIHEMQFDSYFIIVYLIFIIPCAIDFTTYLIDNFMGVRHTTLTGLDLIWLSPSLLLINNGNHIKNEQLPFLLIGRMIKPFNKVN